MQKKKKKRVQNFSYNRKKGPQSKGTVLEAVTWRNSVYYLMLDAS